MRNPIMGESLPGPEEQGGGTCKILQEQGEVGQKGGHPFVRGER